MTLLKLISSWHSISSSVAVADTQRHAHVSSRHRLTLWLLTSCCLFLVSIQPVNADVTATKAAFSTTTGSPITSVELGQTIEYSFNWNCNFTGTPPPGECGDFVLVDPLPQGAAFVSCSVPGIYSCSYDPTVLPGAPSGTVTIEALNPLELFVNGQVASASIIVQLSTDISEFPAVPGPLLNIATTSSADGDEDIIASVDINAPTNNWEISKAVIVPASPLQPALDNNVVYQIEVCPNGPEGLGTGTLILENPTITDVCPAGAVVIGATLNGGAVTPAGACPSVDIPLPATFDPSDGCQVVELTLQYPTGAGAPPFADGVSITNEVVLDGDNISAGDCPNSCTDDVTNTLAAPVPDADIDKSSKRSQVAAGAFNRYSIDFDTTSSNIAQTGMEINDVFPAGMNPISLNHRGEWSDTSVTANVIELGTGTIIQTGYNGDPLGFTHTFAAAATGFQVVFTSSVPPGFDGGEFRVDFRTDLGLLVGDSFENCVEVSSDQILPVDNPESCTTVEIIDTTSDINLVKSMPSGVSPGATFTTRFDFTQDDTSSVSAVNPVIADCIPNTLEFVSWDTLAFSGLDDPRNATNTSNSLPVGVEPNFELYAPGDVANTCTDPTNTFIRWSWKASAPAGSTMLDGSPGVANPFSFPIRRDSITPRDNVGDATGELGLFVRVRLQTTLRVKPGVPQQTGLTNSVQAVPENTDFRCLNATVSDVHDIDGDSILGAGDPVCNRNEGFSVLSSAAFGGSKFVAGFPGLPNFDPDNPPIDNTPGASTGIVTPASCPTDASGRTRTPCVAQAMKDQPFNYRIRLSNDGNVLLSDYIVYDILPNTDSAGSDIGVSETQSSTVRGSSWVPLLNGPIMISSANAVVAAEIAANGVIEYSASSNPCRPEMSIADDTLGGDWQAGVCDDDWTTTPLADATTFPNGYASVRAWRLSVPFAAGWPVGNPDDQDQEDIVVDIEMLADPMAPPSDYETLPDPSLQIAWNNIAFRATNQVNDRRLLAGEAIKTGIVMPAEYPLQSTGLRVGNLVWVDSNNDGIAQDGEQGIFDVTVQLWNDVTGDGPTADDTLYDTLQTDAEGHYLFDDANLLNRDNLGIPAGNYYVVIPTAQTGSFSLSDNFSSTTNATTPNDNVDNDDNGAFESDDLVTPVAGLDGLYSGTVNLALTEELTDEQLRNDDATDDDDDFFDDNDSNVSVDFGFYQLRLGNHVWLDSNNDGDADSNEPAIENMQVQLFLDNGDGVFDPDTDTPLGTDTTDNQGQYLFDGLNVGNYFIAIPSAQAGLDANGTAVSIDQLSSSTATSAAGAALASDNGDDGAAGTFGSTTPVSYASVSTLLELTVGGAQTLESDSSLDGVTGSSATDTTDANVELTENIVIDFAFPDTNSYLTADFGFAPAVSLGSTIWVDMNGNGVQDSGEGAIANATVTLLDAAGTVINDAAGNPLTSVTDVNGQYNFNQLPPGTYRVSVDLSPSTVPNIVDYIPTAMQVANPENNSNSDSNIDFSVDMNPNDQIHISGPIILSSGAEPVTETDPINENANGALTDPDQPNQTGLADSSGNMTLDMGFVLPVSLGSTLWVDNNADGIQTVGELPIVGATVFLLNSAGAAFDTNPYLAGIQNSTTTDAQGQYNFDDLPPGTYSVSVDLTGATNSNASALIPTLIQVPDANANPLAAASNLDSNVDTDNAGNNAATDVWFSEQVMLTVGGEVTGEVDPIGTPGADQPNQGLLPADDPDASGNMTLDMGFIEPVSIGSTVWIDSDLDGTQDDNELGVIGATVTLLDSTGTPVTFDVDPSVPGVQNSVTSDATGQYNFDGLPAGSYFVEVTFPSGGLSSLLPTPIQIAGANTNDSNSDSNIATTNNNGTPLDTSDDRYRSELIVLTTGGEPTNEVDAIDANTTGGALSDQPNQDTLADPDANGNMTIDFGFFAAVSLGSTVWLDANANGTQDDAESGIAGATVVLLSANGNPVASVAPVMTDATGQYNFDGLLPGDYRVRVTLPADRSYAPTPTQVADPDAAGDVNGDSNVDLGVPGTAVGVAAGDAANDDTYTSGVVTLTPNGEPINEVDPIDANPAGGNVTDQPNQDTSIGGTDPDSSGNMTVDFGFIETVSLGSTLWVDDGDGIQEAGELPIVGATVTLLDSAGTPVTFDADPTTAGIQNSVVTDAQGQYNFDDLPAGTYSVSVDLTGATNTNASALIPTLVQVADANANPLLAASNLDSNVDVDNAGNDAATDVWFSEQVTLTVGGEATGEIDPIGTPGVDQPNQGLSLVNDPDSSGNMTLDMGFIEPVSIGSTVWLDSDLNGTQDDNELGVVGAVVSLLDSTGTPVTFDVDPSTPGIQNSVTTDATGQYNFDGLPAGSYFVEVTFPSGGLSSLLPTPIQIAGANTNDANSDSNIATTNNNGTPLDTSDDRYRSELIVLTAGGEPTNEVDAIDANTTGGALSDQPNQDTLADPDANGNMTIDFGFFAAVSLGSTIWEDFDGDGTQDLGELGILGATITLLDSAGIPVTFDVDPNTPGVQNSVLSDATGQYNFDGLLPGSYRVQVDLSTVTGGSDLVASPVQVADPDAAMGVDDNTDSNIDFAADTNTLDQIHISGLIDLSPGTEPENEVDTIGAGGTDQPNQDTAVGGADPDDSGNMTLDMGFVRPVSLGSTIWQDENADGTQDDGESPIANATVTLLTSTGAVFDQDPYTAGIQPAVTTTDNQGQYFFNGLPPGDYRVQVDLSTVVGGGALIPTPVQVADPDALGDDNTDSNIDIVFDPNASDQTHISGVITLSAGGEPTSEVDPIDLIDGNGDVSDAPGQAAANPDNSGNMTVDMGFYVPVSIGSFVWQDTNGDGLQDSTEPPLAGATVELLLQTAPGVFGPALTVLGFPVANSTVGADGLYEFTNLPPGDYKVQVTPPSGFFPSPLQNIAANSDIENDSNIAAELGGNLFESAVFSVTSGGEPNELNPSTNRGDGQDGAPASAEDLSGNMTIDFGFVVQASLGNYVWLDLDMDGVQDANEEGIANVTVNLYEDTNRDGMIDGAEATTPVATATTGLNGEYVFTGLRPGVAYQTGVDVATLTPGLVQTFDEGDGVGATDSLSDPIVLDPNEFHETADFGYAPASGVGAVGDTIWVDANDNGIQDPGESGIAGVTVSITPAPDVDLGAGLGVAITTVTDVNGRYLFPNLPLGETYIVEVDITTLPAGYASGPSNLGDPDVRDGNSSIADNQTTVVLTTENPINLDLDFGYLPPADQNNSVGDTIWLDIDRDGEGPVGANTGVDVLEQPVPGVTVSLLNSLNVVVGTTTTDANGQYLFTGLPDGQYTVIVTDQNNVLNGLEQTYDNDDGVNATPATPNRSVVDLDSAGLLGTPVDDRDQDFGYIRPNGINGDGTIGDTIFFDENGSGAPDAGEGIEGVTVQLFAPGPDGVIGGGDDILIGSTTTDENGNYLFTGLDTSDTGPNPGTEYQVVVVPSSLPNGGSGWSNTVDPDNAAGAGDNESITTLTSAEPIDLDQDFGYLSDDDNSLSGTIWPDTNGDGELVEGGRFSGVTVELRDQNGNVIATTRTDVNGDFSFENLPDGIYMVVVTDDDNVLSGFEHTNSPNGTSDTSDSTSKDDTGYFVDLDSAGVDPNPVSDTTSDFGYQPTITNPISLGSFIATSGDDGEVVFSWATQTEVANIGFNLFGLVDGQWQTLNKKIVIGLGDSVSVQKYDLVVITDATVFALSDIDLAGKETLHGPFELSKQYGFIAERRPIDWLSEKAERDGKQAKRQKARRAQQSVQKIRRQQKTKSVESE